MSAFCRLAAWSTGSRANKRLCCAKWFDPGRAQPATTRTACYYAYLRHWLIDVRCCCCCCCCRRPGLASGKILRFGAEWRRSSRNAGGNERRTAGVGGRSARQSARPASRHTSTGSGRAHAQVHSAWVQANLSWRAPCLLVGRQQRQRRRGEKQQQQQQQQQLGGQPAAAADKLKQLVAVVELFVRAFGALWTGSVGGGKLRRSKWSRVRPPVRPFASPLARPSRPPACLAACSSVSKAAHQLGVATAPLWHY